MSNTLIPARDRAGFRSNDALAKALLVQSPDHFFNLTLRSLGVKLGELDKGKVKWWLRRPEAAGALAAALQVSEQDLGLHAVASQVRVHTFDEYPELPPFTLQSESPCELGRAVRQKSLGHDRDESLDLDKWLRPQKPNSHRLLEPDGFHWLHMPQGTGRKMLQARMAARSPYPVLAVTSLAEATHRLQRTEPLILVIEQPGGDADLHAMAASTCTALLILAPFAAPLRRRALPQESFLDIDHIRASPQERARRELTNPDGVLFSRLSISRYDWTLDIGWRTTLLRWVEERLNRLRVDTLFNADETAEWLDQFDAEGLVVRTPSDVLAMCRIFHHLDRGRRPSPTRADAGRLLQAQIRRLNSRVADHFDHLVEGQWRRTDLPWRAALGWRHWREIAGGGFIDEGQADRVNRAVKSAVTRARAAKCPDLEVARSEGLLVEERRTGLGNFALTPALLADLGARDLVIQDIRDGAIERWGLPCFDTSRQHLVDAGIRTLRTAELLPSIRRVIAGEVWDAAAIGASETLFMVLGERIAFGESMTPDMQQLAAIVLGRCLKFGEEYYPHAWSRGVTRGVDDENSLGWEGALWAWSLTPKPRDLQIPEAWAHDFPGWLSTVWEPGGLAEHPGRIFPQLVSPPRWKRLIRVAMAVLQRLKRPPAIQDQNIVFFSPLLLAASASGKWSADVRWWKSTITNAWADRFLTDKLEATKEKAGAIALWRSLLEFTGQPHDLIVDFQTARSGCWEWLINTMSPAEAMDELNPDQLRAVLNMPSMQPPEFRRHLLATIDLSYWHSVADLMGLCQEEDSSLLVRWLNTPANYHAARILWSVSPNTALQVLRSNEALDGDALFFLVDFAPDEKTAEVARFLLEQPGVIEASSRQVWARDRLTTVRGHAPLLLQVLQAH
ncbi:MAG: hypothetical protein V4542_01695 [Pseudomonadota bacterium]